MEKRDKPPKSSRNWCDPRSMRESYNSLRSRENHCFPTWRQTLFPRLIQDNFYIWLSRILVSTQHILQKSPCAEWTKPAAVDLTSPRHITCLLEQNVYSLKEDTRLEDPFCLGIKRLENWLCNWTLVNNSFSLEYLFESRTLIFSTNYIPTMYFQ